MRGVEWTFDVAETLSLFGKCGVLRHGWKGGGYTLMFKFSEILA